MKPIKQICLEGESLALSLPELAEKNGSCFWMKLGGSDNHYAKVSPPEAVAQRCSVKMVLLKFSQNSQENTCAEVSFLIKLQAEACNFIKKETLAEVFSCEFCAIYENTFFYRTPPVAASAH